MPIANSQQPIADSFEMYTNSSNFISRQFSRGHSSYCLPEANLTMDITHTVPFSINTIHRVVATLFLAIIIIPWLFVTKIIKSIQYMCRRRLKTSQSVLTQYQFEWNSFFFFSFVSHILFDHDKQNRNDIFFLFDTDIGLEDIMCAVKVATFQIQHLH